MVIRQQYVHTVHISDENPIIATASFPITGTYIAIDKRAGSHVQAVCKVSADLRPL